MFKKGTAAIAAAAAILLLSSCSLLSQDAPRDESGQVTEASTISVFSLQTGDCFDQASMGSGEVNTVKVVPCSEPHDGEVFGDLTATDATYPGEDALWERGGDYCYEQFEAYVGIDYFDSKYDFYTLTPTQASWDQDNDRLIQCILEVKGETVSESLKGANA